MSSTKRAHCGRGAAGGVAGAGAGSKEEDYHEYVKPVKEDDLPSGWKVLRVQTFV